MRDLCRSCRYNVFVAAVLVCVCLFGSSAAAAEQLTLHEASSASMPDLTTRLPQELISLVRAADADECGKIDQAYDQWREGGGVRTDLLPKEELICYAMRAVRLQRVVTLLSAHIPAFRTAADDPTSDQERLGVTIAIATEFVDRAVNPCDSTCVSCDMVYSYLGTDMLAEGFDSDYPAFLERVDHLSESGRLLASIKSTRTEIVPVLDELEALKPDLLRAAQLMEQAALIEWRRELASHPIGEKMR